MNPVDAALMAGIQWKSSAPAETSELKTMGNSVCAKEELGTAGSGPIVGIILKSPRATSFNSQFVFGFFSNTPDVHWP